MKPKVEGFVFEDTEHHGDTLERLNSLRKNGRFCDVVLQLGKHEMQAHRAVLASASAYLMDLFARMDADETWDGRVKLNSLTIPEFQILLDYIYTGRLEVPSDGNVKAVYRMSRKLKLARPAEACVDYMTKNLDADNCVGTRACGSGHSDSALTNVCDEYIGLNVQAVASSKDCLSLPRIQVEIVGTDDITINDSNEEGLFNLVLRWIREKLEADENDDGLIADHVHVLYLSTDNVLLDCKDLDVDVKVQNTEYIKDYKKLHKLRQKKPSDTTGVRGKKDAKSPANGDSVTKVRKLTFAPIENPVTETEWKIIVSEKTADHQYMCICVLNAKLATVSIHLRQRPSSANSNSNGESSDNGTISPRTVRKSVKSGSSSPTYLDRQMSLVPLAKMSCSRSGLGSVLLNGKIVALGGYERGECLRTVEAYDIRENRWTALPDMNNPRGRFDATMCDGCLYACGGSNGLTELKSAECYKPEAGEWVLLKDMYKPRASPGTAAWKGRLYCIGGSNGQGGMKSCEMYDPETQSWSEIKNMKTRRSETGVCALNDLIYAVGGCDSWNCLNTAEVYDPCKDKWESIPPMSSCRRGAGLVAFMGKVYVIGGSDGQSSLNTVEIYDPELSVWTTGPAFNTPRVNLSAAVADGRIYILGGFSGKSFLDTIEYLDGDTNEWCIYVPGSIPDFLLPATEQFNGGVQSDTSHACSGPCYGRGSSEEAPSSGTNGIDSPDPV